MVADYLTMPRFRRGQTVEFAGGAGIVQQCRPESDTWIYLVQMEMGPEPEMGRVGFETMIWLPDAELC